MNMKFGNEGNEFDHLYHDDVERTMVDAAMGRLLLNLPDSLRQEGVEAISVETLEYLLSSTRSSVTMGFKAWRAMAEMTLDG